MITGNRCSRSTGLSVQDQLDWMFTIKRNPCSQSTGTRKLSAAIELRRRFPGITDNAKARAHARRIAGWTPLSVRPRPVTRLRPRKD
ncbi:MAG TPA: hypothetical protein VF021_08035, partial [Longimicrobiales bacterium]